jgi:flagellar motor switch protein FliM
MSDEAISNDNLDDLLNGVDPINSSIEIPIDTPPNRETAAATTGQTDPRRVARQASTAEAYSLGREVPVPSEQMPALELSIARFTKLFGPQLRSIALRPIEINSTPLKVQRYDEFLAQHTEPSYCGVVSLEPLQGEGLLCFSSTLLMLIVDHLYGGQGRLAMTESDRGISASVRRIAERLLLAMSNSFSAAVRELVPIEMTLRRQEQAPALARIAQAKDFVVVIGLSAVLGEETHSICLCLPYLAIEPFRTRLRQSDTSEGPLNHRRWMDLLLDQVKLAEVELIADLASAPATLADLAAFKVGDFIELDLRSSLIARIADVPVLSCGYGLSNGHYAIRVHDFLMANDSSGKIPNHVQ